ncbi:flagellar biosynthesis protein FlhF [Inediibacterium massiliense]|uniref:flagellar biosynthesis protein FlhF n=1 Tax=Inediibacterium massiliense TaxID=1658111 RepID=UPI0006B676DD|nr:flagellar biosynthesis protein FlhF [Inediibacterium massiliense]
MKVKRYIASNAQEAMLKVKTELGVNAVILHSRKIKRPGISGFFKKPLIEMVAAIEDNDKKPIEYKTRLNEKKNIQPKEESNKMEQLQQQVGNIQDLLNNFIEKVELNPQRDTAKNPTMFEKYYDLLSQKNIEKSIIEKILNIAKKRISFSEDNEEAICKTIKMVIKEYLGVAEPMKEEMGQKIILFVGPTGVGKTTTLAKLAAKLSIGQNKSIGFITSDTYRIAAVEQLRTYGEILGIPVKVIYESQEIEEAIKGYSDKDIILIDTAGRNHKSSIQLEEIKEMIQYIKDPEIFLVMSATTGYKDIMNIVNAYEFLDDYRLLFTKLDESDGFGNILNTKIFTGKNLSYVTIGQSVPDDIEIADPEKIANAIVGESNE